MRDAVVAGAVSRLARARRSALSSVALRRATTASCLLTRLKASSKDLGPVRVALVGISRGRPRTLGPDFAGPGTSVIGDVLVSGAPHTRVQLEQLVFVETRHLLRLGRAYDLKVRLAQRLEQLLHHVSDRR